MTKKLYRSWGGILASQQRVLKFKDGETQSVVNSDASTSYLAFGNGLSYGDVCVNENGALIDCSSLADILGFNVETGVLTIEGGLKFSDIHRLTIPEGWFLPVTPGTEYVTVGGAIANDVHGKNHGHAGSFGCHVLSFDLLRSDGQVYHCSKRENSDLFAATIGGLGLTGLILRASIQLKEISSEVVIADSDRFDDIDGFFDLSNRCGDDQEYSVAWVDCSAKGRSLGRGVFFRGRHATSSEVESLATTVQAPKKLVFPVTPPISIVNRPVVRIFNELYYRLHKNVAESKATHYKKFFYPLDFVRHWNRIYGRKGFFQFQSIIPPEHARSALEEQLTVASSWGGGSFLAVLKVMGDKRAEGLMSFARPGVTLALDIPNHGSKSTSVLRTLEEICVKYGGAINPSKDASMSKRAFDIGYPNQRRFQDFIDPKFSSSFWRRVSMNE